MIWGERIRLKRLELDDIKKMMNWGINEDDLFDDYNFPSMSEAEQTMWFARKNQHGKRCYCIFNKANRLIGYIALRKLNYLDKSGEIGIVMDPDYHNMNYGTEAITLFLTWFFRDFKFNKLNLTVAAYNKRAIRCYDKIGFVPKKVHYDKFYNQTMDPFDGKHEDIEKYFRDSANGMQTKYIKMTISKAQFYKKHENLNTL
ncbi:MAG: GNAT family protein [Proteocatella sp.]